MNIVYLVFGDKIDHYQQVYFSIYTAMARKSSDDRILVVAENPDLFNSIGDRIEIIPIDRKKITEWEGEHKFFWRVKIKALEHVAEKYPDEDLLYLDGDTFFYEYADELRAKLQSGQNFMHLEEGKLAKLKSKTERKMWQQMQGKTYSGIKIDENSAMWNAGMIAISHKNFACLKLTLDLNDAMCADGVTRRLIEQFAFSLGLNEHSGLKPADHVVGHYWGNKNQWNTLISNFLKVAFMKHYSLEKIIKEVKEMDFTKIPIRVRESSTQRKLTKFVDSFYGDLKPVYIRK